MSRPRYGQWAVAPFSSSVELSTVHLNLAGPVICHRGIICYTHLDPYRAPALASVWLRRLLDQACHMSCSLSASSRCPGAQDYA